MKRLFSMVGLSFIIATIVVLPVLAAVKANSNVIVRKDEVINDDLFVAGDEVTIEGTINGDVYAGAQRLNIRGEVNGDVIAGANTIIVTGKVKDDLRVAGNSISLIGAEIGDSVSVGGNELSIDRKSTIGGGLIFGGRLLSLSGSVGRGIMAGGDTTRIDNTVNKTVRIAATNITIDEQALIKGDLEYQSDNEAEIYGEIKGEVVRKEGSGVNLDTENLLRRVVIGFSVWAFLGALIVGAVMLLLMPNVFRKATKKFSKKPWPIVGWGTVALLATLPAAIILMVTFIGIPLAILLLVFWMIALYLAKFFTAYLVGDTILKAMKQNTKNYHPNAYLALLIGLVLYYILRLIPVIGLFVRLGTSIVGMGLILALYSRSTSNDKKKQ